MLVNEQQIYVREGVPWADVDVPDSDTAVRKRSRPPRWRHTRSREFHVRRKEEGSAKTQRVLLQGSERKNTPSDDFPFVESVVESDSTKALKERFV